MPRRPSIASSSFTESNATKPLPAYKDRDVLLAFYDFPAEHWKHLRTTNPIESKFATVPHRTIKTALAMVFKLVGAQKTFYLNPYPTNPEHVGLKQ